jgi:hypothetical protein
MPRADRLTGLGTTGFTEMTALAQRTGAINLGQGFPDTDDAVRVPAHVAAIVTLSAWGRPCREPTVA